MDIWIAVGLIVLGLALLAIGGEALVRAAATLAELAGVTPAVIGLTVVAMATSLPELTVSIIAAARGQPDLAVGNVVGSNIFNVAAILGIAALVKPLPVHGNAVRLEWPFMFVTSFLCVLLARDGSLDRLEGGFFVTSLVLFVGYTVRLARTEVGAGEAGRIAAEVESRDIDVAAGRGVGRKLAMSLIALGVGVLALVGGGRFLVDGSVALARIAGLSERVIGLTIVAAGTSAPELATSLVASLRGRADVAVANIIGSNIFNVLGILGLTALILPVPVAPQIVGGDMWWMLGTSLLLLPVLRFGASVSRPEGALLLASYAVYLFALLR
jgi:cation:H+ antiporter